MSVTGSPRFNMLDPYLESLRGASARNVCEPLLATLDGQEIMVDEWALERLDEFLAGSSGTGETEQLVADSIALLTKYAADLASAGATDAGSLPNGPQAEAELMLDAAIGMALVKQIQSVIDRLLRDGSIQQARPLSRFHHTLRNAAFDARRRIHSAHHQRLDDLTTDLAASVGHESVQEPEAGATTPARTDTEKAHQKQQEVVRRRARPIAIATTRKASKLPSLTEVLILLVVVAIALQYGSQRFQQQPVVVPDPPGRGEIAAIDSGWTFEFRYPSVFATVDRSDWDALNPEQRNALLLRVSQLVGTHRYSSLFLTSTEGHPLARWKATTGRSMSSAAQKPEVGWKQL